MIDPSSLSTATRRRALIAILGDTFLMWGGFFMVVPLISVHYVDDLGWAAAAVGLVLGLRQLVQQGFTLVGGMLADRLGAKWLVCAGLLMRAAAFATMARADSFELLLGSSMLAALGGALFEAPKAATIAALTDESNRARFYSLMGVVGGLGMTAGPLVGALLLRADFAFVAYGAAVCFVGCFLVTLLFVPPIKVATENRGLTHGLRLALHDRSFVIFTLLLMGYWFMWVQLTLSLPLVARAISGTSDAVSWIYAINSGLNVLLQYPLVRLGERRLRPLSMLVLGVALMALGLGGVALAHGVPLLLLCVVLFSLGGLLATPSQQTVTAELANPAALGSYFGVSALALALGGGMGSYSGGLLYGLGQRIGAPALPWLVFCTVGLCAATGLWLLATRRPALVERRTAPVGPG